MSVLILVRKNKRRKKFYKECKKNTHKRKSAFVRIVKIQQLENRSIPTSGNFNLLIA